MLDRELQPKLSYGLLHETVTAQLTGHSLTAADISAAVCTIRQQKLPDPKMLANAGSFFKNPEADQVTMTRLKVEFPVLLHLQLHPVGS